MITELESKLEAEQKKLASLERSLSGEIQPVTPGQQQEQEEEHVSEEWLHSLKERRKVSKLLNYLELDR